MVEDVDEHEVGERPLGVGKRFGVDDLVRPRRPLDVGRPHLRAHTLEGCDPRAELDGVAGHGREALADQPVPLVVERAHQWPLVPGALLALERLDERRRPLAQAATTSRSTAAISSTRVRRESRSRHSSDS